MAKTNNTQTVKSISWLAGYDRRFVRSFGVIAAHLHMLTKINSFEWSEEAHEAFDGLKNALCQAPVLALINSLLLKPTLVAKGLVQF